LAAAVAARTAGHAVTLMEAARVPGGRARTLSVTLPDGSTHRLDNGQHILIGAYRDTLALMATVGLRPEQLCHRSPLQLLDAQGRGLRLPNWPAPLDAVWGIATARGWPLADRMSLLLHAIGWRWSGFTCPHRLTVAQLCRRMSATLMAGFIEPLCVSALNTPATQASAQVFLRVLHDSLMGPPGSSHVLIPRYALGELLPDAALAWLQHPARTVLPTPATATASEPTGEPAQVKLGHRVHHLTRPTTATEHPDLMHTHTGRTGWLLDGEPFDQVILAVPAWEAARLVADINPDWSACAQQLRHEAIATVYTLSEPGVRLHGPMIALHSNAQAPAQFVFDRGQLNGPAGLLAWVVSAASGTRAEIQAAVQRQAHQQLGIAARAVLTGVEKRATFACAPHVFRPQANIAPGLSACGDYVAGPYPATLEGAVRSGRAAAAGLS
jgi:squalene-associated FAD-dependent desaturase